MKVIKQGIIPGDYVYQATCTYCKTEIEFAAKEAKQTSDQRDGDFLTVHCPTCGREIHKDMRR